MSTKPVVLTIISEKELPQPTSPLGMLTGIFTQDPRVVYLKHFTAVNVKFAAYDRGFGKVIDQAGCERHSWEYLEMRSLEQAEVLAKKLATKCYQHQIKVFNANAEAGTSGTTPYSPYPNPYYVLQHFVKIFRLCAPSYTELWYNGFSWGVTSDGRRLHDAPLINLFDAWCPMNYGTSAAGIEKYWNDKCFKYRNRLPDLQVIPMLGVGRVDKDGSTWGFWATHKKLLTTTPVNGVSFYFGNGAKSQMLVGNKKHPALIACVQDLRDSPGWEV